MENIIIHPNPDTPYFPGVTFDKKGTCELYGESYMEETYKFYAPLLEWLKNYCDTKQPLEFNIKLSYFNTSSSRIIIEILELLKKYKSSGSQVSINWFYSTDDPDMKDEIQDFIEEVGTEINIFESNS